MLVSHIGPHDRPLLLDFLEMGVQTVVGLVARFTTGVHEHQHRRLLQQFEHPLQLERQVVGLHGLHHVLLDLLLVPDVSVEYLSPAAVFVEVQSVLLPAFYLAVIELYQVDRDEEEETVHLRREGHQVVHLLGVVMGGVVHPFEQEELLPIDGNESLQGVAVLDGLEEDGPPLDQELVQQEEVYFVECLVSLLLVHLRGVLDQVLFQLVIALVQGQNSRQVVIPGLDSRRLL